MVKFSIFLDGKTKHLISRVSPIKIVLVLLGTLELLELDIGNVFEVFFGEFNSNCLQLGKDLIGMSAVLHIIIVRIISIKISYQC